MKNKRSLNALICALGAFSAIALIMLDQYTKMLAAVHLKGQEDISLIPNVLVLKYLYPENRGIAFGMFQGNVFTFAVITFLMLVAILFVFVRVPKNKRFLPLNITLVLMIAGAVGNLIDRVFRGYVIDFIYFSLIDFPVFNLADVYVVMSGILLVILIGFVYKDEELSFLNIRKRDN